MRYRFALLLLIVLAATSQAATVRYPATGSFLDVQAAVFGGTDSGGTAFSGVVGTDNIVVIPRGKWFWVPINGEKMVISDSTANGAINTGLFTFLGDGSDTTEIQIGNPAVLATVDTVPQYQSILTIQNNAIAATRPKILGIHFSTGNVKNSDAAITFKNGPDPSSSTTMDSRFEVGFCKFTMLYRPLYLLAVFGVIHDTDYVNARTCSTNGAEKGLWADQIEALRPGSYTSDKFIFFEDNTYSGTDIKTKSRETAMFDNAEQTTPYWVRKSVFSFYGNTVLAPFADAHGDLNCRQTGGYGNILDAMTDITININSPASMGNLFDLRGGDVYIRGITVTSNVAGQGVKVRHREEFYETGSSVGDGGRTGGWQNLNNPCNVATSHISGVTLNGVAVTDPYKIGSGLGVDTDSVLANASFGKTVQDEIQLNSQIRLTGIPGLTEPQYPSPLRGAAFAPVFTNPKTATFSTGTSTSFSVRAFSRPGSATITNTGNALPSGVALNDLGGGRATLVGAPLASGTYNLTFTAHNGNAAPDATQAFTLTVGGAGNVAPTVSMTAPANNATYTAPVTVTISATAVDTDGSIQRVEFFNGSNLIYTDTSPSWTYDFPITAAGTYVLGAKSYDNAGASSALATRTITVSAGSTAPLPPADILIGP